MIKVIDDFFSDKLATELFQYAIKEDKVNSGFKGYSAIDHLSYFNNISFIEKFPELTNTKLTRSWGFIYDNETDGVPPHADPADLNLNIWITPDECVKNEEKNGMKIWLIKPPKSWSFLSYNSNTKKIKEFIGKERALDIPYKYNRAILFDSKYFHATSGVSMKSGTENRRVSFTYLFDRL